MGRIWGWIKRAIGWLGDYQAVAAILPGGLLAVIGGVSTYLADLGLHWIIFLTSGIFCFVTLGYTVARESWRANRLEHKLTVSGFSLEQVPLEAGEGLYRPSFALHNMAGFEIFYVLHRADYSVTNVGSSNPDPTITINGLLAGKDTIPVTLSAVRGAPGIAPSGRLVLDIHYGRERGVLTHSFRTTLTFVSLSAFPAGQGGLHTVLRNVESIDYIKLKA